MMTNAMPTAAQRAAVLGLTLAPATAASATATPAKILELIEAHRIASAAFALAAVELARTESSYLEAQGSEEVIAPNLLDVGVSIYYGADECRKKIVASYESLRPALTALSRIAPDLAEQARAALDAKEAENLALIDKIFAEEEERKEQLGLAAAEHNWERANEAERAAARALCSHNCESLEESRVRAEYILATKIIQEDDEDEYLDALLHSFVLPGAGDHAKA